jgi:hypothetical protein
LAGVSSSTIVQNQEAALPGAKAGELPDLYDSPVHRGEGRGKGRGRLKDYPDNLVLFGSQPMTTWLGMCDASMEEREGSRTYCVLIIPGSKR